MSIRRKIWLLIVLLLAGGAVWFLSPAPARRPGAAPLATAGNAAAVPVVTMIPGSPVFNLLSPGALTARSNAVAAARAEKFRYRISNTSKTIGQLARSETAILLENALIDTASTAPLVIPAALQPPADPGSYLVQARGPVDAAFRAQLAAAGATIVSYIPNNAYLVTAATDLRSLTGSRIQAVYAYAPHFKLKSDLVKLVMQGKPLPENRAVKVLLFPDQRAATGAELEKLGATILAEERSPFGPVLTVRPPGEALAAVAALRGVHTVELLQPRVAANDLSRVRMAVATNSTTAPNYLGLSGANVLVTVSDFGVDTTHPDLAGRVLIDALDPFYSTDTNFIWDTFGHGTHVAGIIASSGANSANLFASGSTNPSVVGQFRGKAPGASILSLPVLRDDAYLQETAVRSNSFIHNSSWSDGTGYNLTAASYDAATRDALPGTTGSQPALYVFSVGNGGGGETDGTGGNSDSIQAPATAKNVISVGSVEQLRNITNLVQPSFDSTNESAIWQAGSDSDNQVAGYSGRGNVGVGEEGDFGRFKPDVMAPGSWVVSTRSTQWDQIAYYNPTNRYSFAYQTQVLGTNGHLNYSVFVPKNAVGLQIEVQPPQNLDLYVNQTGTPTNATPTATDLYTLGFPPGVKDASYDCTVVNPNGQAAKYDLIFTITTTNDNGNTFQVLSNQLNGPLGPFYRYESGSSMAAAAVSGTLALMQEFFEQRLGVTNSPALMKALLINGARPAASVYDFQVQTPINYQGWGLVNLTNSLPATLTANPAGAAAPIQYFDQNPTTALATGQSQTRTISLSAAARNLPLRVTLVWTDPPGDPSASIKLVNDLDLIVTNLDNPEQVYYGNDIQVNNNINLPRDTNSPVNVDFVNNVENVYLAPLGGPLGANYSITVVGRRVNVNAVTAHTNDVAQDYALVISSANGSDAGAITVTSAATGPTPTVTEPLVTSLDSNFGTNAGSKTVGGLLLHQHVGANTPLLGTTNGMTNQWHFFVFTNGTSGFTNVAFATFLPPTLSVPRIGTREGNIANATRLEADIDLYVTTDAGLTNLDPVVIANCINNVGDSRAARKRTGTETVVYSNSIAGQTYYVGVKAEDRQAAEFSLLGVASESPFSEFDGNGNLIVRGIPVPAVIPDGTPDQPEGAFVFGIAIASIDIRRVIVTNTITHELMGDLLGNLSHGEHFVVLNNHTLGDGSLTQTFVYDDSDEHDIAAQASDGPGSLKDFVADDSSGLWLLTMVDNTLIHTGQVDNLTLKIEPKPDTNSVTVTIQPGGFYRTYVDVPPEATNLTVSVSGNTQDVLLLLRRDQEPTLTDFDVQQTINPPGGQITLTRTGTPPLLTGRWFIAVYNPVGNTAQTVTITINVGLDLRGVLPVYYGATNSVPLLDDAVTDGSIIVSDAKRITSVEVGVRIDHERVSDLALTLISPQGTRVLLAENRGGWDTNGYGISRVAITNVYPTATNGGFTEDVRSLFTGATAGTLLLDFTPFSVPDSLIVENNGTVILNTGLVSGTNLLYSVDYGPGTDPNLVITVNKGNNSKTNTQWNYTATVIQNRHSYAIFTEDTAKTTTPIKFAVPPFHGTFGAGVVWTNGFEGAAVRDYVTGEIIDGWDVVQGTADDLVTVNANLTAGIPEAHEGSNFLSFDVASFGALFTNAPIIATTLPTIAGRRYNLNFYWKVAASPGSFQVRLAGVYTNTFTPNGNENWIYETRTFTAPTNGTRLELEGLVPYVLLDDFTLTELPTPTYYLPEESLAALTGERAKGEWKLEVWDNRVGAAILGPTLVSWNLSFIYEDTAPPGSFSGGSAPAFLNTSVAGSVYTNDELTAFVLTNAAASTNPGAILTYNLVNPPPGATISSNGVITWTPTEAQGPGSYAITTIVSDNSLPPLSTVNSFTVVVNEVNTAPTLPVIPAQTINSVTNVTLIANTATDVDLPVNPLTYTLTAIEIATGLPVTTNPPVIYTNGVIAWTPTAPLALGDYTLTTIVTDTNAAALTNQTLSATNSFTVTVNAVAPALVFNAASVVVTSNRITLRWTAPSFDRFAIQWASNLTQPQPWPEFTNRISSDTTNFQFMDDGTQTGGLSPLRFYRLRSLP